MGIAVQNSGTTPGANPARKSYMNRLLLAVVGSITSIATWGAFRTSREASSFLMSSRRDRSARFLLTRSAPTTAPSPSFT
jgi:hypothetical protein